MVFNRYTYPKIWGYSVLKAYKFFLPRWSVRCQAGFFGHFVEILAALENTSLTNCRLGGVNHEGIIFLSLHLFPQQGTGSAFERL